MTIATCIIEARYQNWYDKAMDYAFDFFDDPLYGEANQKDFLSKLLLDPKTWLILLAYLTYQLQRLYTLITEYDGITTLTNVAKRAVFLNTYVSRASFLLETIVNKTTDLPTIAEAPCPFLSFKEKRKVFFPAYSAYIMGGWAFLRIFRKLLLIHLVNDHIPWRKTIIPCFQKGFRYVLKGLPCLLIGHRPSGNMPSWQPSFC